MFWLDATAPTGNTQRLFFSCFLHEKGHKLRWQSDLVLACNCTQLRILQLHTWQPATLTGLTAIVVLLQMSPNTDNSSSQDKWRLEHFQYILLRIWLDFSANVDFKIHNCLQIINMKFVFSPQFLLSSIWTFLQSIHINISLNLAPALLPHAGQGFAPTHCSCKSTRDWRGGGGCCWS